MRCRNCGSRMEREDTLRMAHNGAGDMIQATPSAEYVCAECGSVWEWVKGKGLHAVYDSKTYEGRESIDLE